METKSLEFAELCHALPALHTGLQQSCYGEFGSEDWASWQNHWYEVRQQPESIHMEDFAAIQAQCLHQFYCQRFDNWLQDRSMSMLPQDSWQGVLLHPLFIAPALGDLLLGRLADRQLLDYLDQIILLLDGLMTLSPSTSMRTCWRHMQAVYNKVGRAVVAKPNLGLKACLNISAFCRLSPWSYVDSKAFTTCVVLLLSHCLPPLLKQLNIHRGLRKQVSQALQRSEACLHAQNKAPLSSSGWHRWWQMADATLQVGGEIIKIKS